MLGESGSGKTENSKLILKTLAQISNKSHGNLTEKMMYIHIILECFGNAKTISNENSSRFTKLVTLSINCNTREIASVKI